ncbi:MAG: serine/threonine-protein kinase [Gemmatimonadota bacterium]
MESDMHEGSAGVTVLGDRYELGEEIAVGGAAVVHRGHDRVLGRAVAIKLLAATLELGRDHDRFEREIAILGQLQHPHIVPVLGSGLHDGTLYYVMPFAPDGTLADRLKSEGPLSIEAVRTLATEMTSALARAHGFGVIHRDVKPSNVLVSGDHYWLADFGIVRFLQDAESSRFTPSGIMLGSPRYMSPEQLVGRAGVDYRTDLYSLGLVLYECLAGVAAFPARTAEASARLRLVSDPITVRAHRPDVDAALEGVVMRALRGDVEQRWTSAAEMAAAL